MTYDELQALLDSTPLMLGIAWNIIVPALISAMGMLKGGGSSGGAAGSADQMMTPEMREMLQMQVQRMRGQEPLYKDVMGMARGLLPTRYRNAQPYSGRRDNPTEGGPSSPGGYAPGMPNHDPTKPNGGWIPPHER